MSEVTETVDQTFVEDSIASGGRVVVKFTAPAWCVPCQKFAPVYKVTAANDSGGTTFLAVDVDNAPWAMQDYGIRGVPTVVLFEHGERVRDLKERTAIRFMQELG